MTKQQKVADFLPPVEEILAGLETLKPTYKLSVKGKKFKTPEELLDFIHDKKNQDVETSDGCPLSKNRSFIDIAALLAPWLSFPEAIEAAWRNMLAHDFVSFHCCDINRQIIWKSSYAGYFHNISLGYVEEMPGWAKEKKNYVQWYLLWLTLEELKKK